MAAVKPCKVDGCDLPKDLPSHHCYWHRMTGLLIDEQIEHALERRRMTLATKPERARVPAESWPAGRRWCSGCQFFCPLWYTQGSRCKACASHASYSAHLLKEYGVTHDTYLLLFKAQKGRCYICQKVPKTRRLALDHDHVTNEVRGLLCSGERSCNHDVLGNIKDLDAARRIVAYLEDPPYRQLQRSGQLVDNIAPATNSTEVRGPGGTRPPVNWRECPCDTRRLMMEMAREEWEAKKARDAEKLANADRMPLVRSIKD